MQQISFLNLPEHFLLLLNQIKEETLKKIYSNFTFLYFPFHQIRENECVSEDYKDIRSFLYNYLKEFKFITYCLTKRNETKGNSTIINEKENSTSNKGLNQEIDIIFCVECHCIIIERIDLQLIKTIIDNLGSNKCSMINVGPKIEKEPRESIYFAVKEEISGFCNHLIIQKEILNNDFVELTIPPIIGYMIRRYFQPSNYFKDPSFFVFDNFQNKNEKRIKKKLTELFESGIDVKGQMIKTIVNEIKNSNFENTKYRNFKNEDLIILRKIVSTQEAHFYITIHLSSLYVFLLKKGEEDSLQHEFEFCEKYQNRFVNRFYGFLLNEKGEKIGFLYEFLSNGSLSSFIQKDENRNNVFFCLLSILRIFQAIEYLHSNGLIYRDLKPSNILINHDNIPFLSDFDTIRQPSDDMTSDIGSYLYTSPEQDEVCSYSYPTDIYSFGLVIYYLYQREHFKLSNKKFIENASTNIQNLFQRCINHSPEKRPTIQEVKMYLIEEVNSINRRALILKNKQIAQLVQFAYECVLIQSNSTGFDISNISNAILYLCCIRYSDYAAYLYKLGTFYEEGECFTKDNYKAFKSYLISSQLNNSDSMCKMGIYYRDGIFVQKSYSLAFEYFSKSSKSNNIEAIYNLGSFYFEGFFVRQNYAKAREYFELAASHNNAEALFHLGLIYHEGFGVKKDYKKAKEYYELSAKQYFSYAIHNLGVLFQNGFGVTQDYSKANSYFNLAVSLNNSASMVNLGINYFMGNGVEPDISKAEFYYKLAVQHNNDDSALKSLIYNGKHIIKLTGNKNSFISLIKKMQPIKQPNELQQLCSLGFYYLYGINVDKNIGKALEYFESAAKRGDLTSMIYLGNIYFTGDFFSPNFEKSRKYFELASEHEFSYSNLMLGRFYYLGLGVNVDYYKSLKYFEISSKQNNPNALNLLGNQYCRGLGVEQDYDKARICYELAAKQRHPSALNNLGNIYFNGFGVDQNYNKAKEFYELAVQFNCSTASLNLGIIYSYGLGVQIDIEKGIQYFESAANQDDNDSYYCLGKLYMDFQNYEKAKEYFELGAKINDPKSLLKLGYLYFYGLGVQKDFTKTKYYFELAAKKNDTDALAFLGMLYYEGNGVVKDIPRAKHYFKLAANGSNSKASFNLGFIYFNEKLYAKAIEYFKLAAMHNQTESLLYLGIMHFYGYGVEKDHSKAKLYIERAAANGNSTAFINLGKLCFNERDYKQSEYYFEKAAEKNDPEAFYLLANLYSNVGLNYKIDISKAIHYYTKCIEYDDKLHSIYNKYKYIANNDLGLIYLINFDDIETATQFLKEAGLNEYPHGQNNLGLLYQFYLNNMGNADYMYQRASKNNFALAQFNLGYLNEKNGNDQKAIEFYILASKNENSQLSFHNLIKTDVQFEISKTFIITLANLKIVHYYLLQSNFEEARKFFIKTCQKIETVISLLRIMSYHNKLKFLMKNSNSIYDYLNHFILILKLCGLNQQNNLNLKPVSINFTFLIDDPGKMFDYFIQNNILTSVFIKDVNDLIQTISSIIYNPPYLILFGRIKFTNLEDEEKTNHEHINELFYEGFEFN